MPSDELEASIKDLLGTLLLENLRLKAQLSALQQQYKDLLEKA